MRALDTNIVVRYLTGDDPEQAARAKAAIDAGPVFVSTTVLLECDWVLRSVYGFGGRQVAAALRAFAGLPGGRIPAPAHDASRPNWPRSSSVTRAPLPESS